jgi:hypothetical protein
LFRIVERNLLTEGKAAGELGRHRCSVCRTGIGEQ